MAADFGEHCRKIAERFLLTAIVVDDEPYYDHERPGLLQTPGRKRRATADDAQAPERQNRRQSLNARAISESFARHGIVCGIVAPGESDGDRDYFVAVCRADVVVIDWQLRGDGGKTAVDLVKFILGNDEGDRLRLIAIYTGEDRLDEIVSTISQQAEASGMKLQRGVQARSDLELSRGHCRIAPYAKSETGLPREFVARVVPEHLLAERLIGDFSELVGGLLPSIALTALTAIRENTHRVLDKFETKLVPVHKSASCLVRMN